MKPPQPIDEALRICEIEDCGRKHHARGYCHKHYGRLMMQGDPNKVLRYKHGLYKHPSYSAWKSMRTRCTNPNVPEYKYYGARGIKVCERWDDFSLFLKDMGERPSKQHSLDRIDVNGDYEPSNCRWATQTQQNLNQCLSTRNTSGYTGVSFNSRSQKWLAYININKKHHSLGQFDSRDEAIAARESAVRDYAVREAVTAALKRIPEPTMADVFPTNPGNNPGSYDDMLKVVRWYKQVIANELSKWEEAE